MSEARVAVESDWMRDGVRIAGRLSKQVYVKGWGSTLTLAHAEPLEGSREMSDGDEWLHLPLDLARALYEGLADHFGHSGNDTRALRRDYDAERARVDKMLAALVEVRA